MNNLIELLRQQFRENSPKPALIYRGETLTYGELEKRVEGVGAFLQQQGLHKGDIVVLYLQEKLACLVLHLGIILAGGVSLPLNFNFTGEEMVYFLNDSGARFILASGQQAELIRVIKDRCPRLQAVFGPEIAVGHRGSQRFKEVEIRGKDHCLMLYSSGTTGRPKGVVHTQANAAASLLALQKWWRFAPDDVLLNVLPLFHIHGLCFASHLSLISGSCMIIEERFHLRLTLDRIKDATVFMGVPTFYYAFLDRPEFREKARHWVGVRLFTCGSAPIRPEVLGEIEGIIGKPLINRYGMTESHVITSLPLDGPFKPGSVGLPLNGIEMKIEKGDNLTGYREKQDRVKEPHLDTDGAGQAETTRTGEVKVRSRNLFSHYWRKPGASREAFDHDGFFCTGDLGYQDEDGFLFLVGRKDDMIITSGYNVYPPVVERVINDFPGVKESAVIGIPDARRGERLAAAIVTEGAMDIDIRALKQFCREKLVDYQCPVIFEIVDQLPRNAMGKVLKRRLKERFQGI